MKPTRFFTSGIIMLFLWVMLFNSCSEDDSIAPTVQFTAEADGGMVDLIVEATNAAGYFWDYGDGTTSTTLGSHTHIYGESGDYTIKVVVVSFDHLTSTQTADVEVEISAKDLIAGFSDEGKTWVLTRAESSFSGKNGVGLVTNDVAILPEMNVVPNGVLTIFGLGDEYTDEFTFYRDGTFKIDVKNGRGLADIVYANIVSPNDKIESYDSGSLPLASIPFANVSDATWELSYNNRTVDWYDVFVTQSVQSTTFTFPENSPDKLAEIKISTGAYLAVNDLYYPDPIATALGLPGPVDNSLYILKDVTDDAMHIAVGINSWPYLPHLPSIMLHLTLVPK